MVEIPDQRTARRIIGQLRSGVPQPEPAVIRFLHIGREKWLQGIQRDIDDACEADASTVRFLKGYYGDGKSHFLLMTMWLALQKKVVVSYVSVERSQIKAFDFELIWKAVIENLGTPESHGESEGIGGLLNRWCEEMADIGPALAGIDRLTRLEPNFRQAIRGFVRAYFEGTGTDIYLRWFQGDNLRPPGIGTRIDQRNSHFMMRSLSYFLKHIGYGGIMVLMDELELILDQTPRVRNSAYESLRQLVDNPLNLPGYIFIGAATPEMFTNQRGFSEYTALQQRAGLAFGLQRHDEPINYRSVVVDLERTPLNTSELVLIAENIRAIFGSAYACDASLLLPDGELSELVQYIEKGMADLSKPRMVVTTTVDILDKKQDDPGYDVLNRIPNDVRLVAERIQLQEQQRHRQIGA